MHKRFHRGQCLFYGGLSLKQHQVVFLPLWQFKNYFYDTLTCNGENGTPAIDTSHRAGLAEDYVTLVACPASSHENTPTSAVCLESLKFFLENRMWPNAQGQKWPYRCDVICCGCTELLCSMFNALLTHRNAKPEKNTWNYGTFGGHATRSPLLCNREWTCTQVGTAFRHFKANTDKERENNWSVQLFMATHDASAGFCTSFM